MTLNEVGKMKDEHKAKILVDLITSTETKVAGSRLTLVPGSESPTLCNRFIHNKKYVIDLVLKTVTDTHTTLSGYLDDTSMSTVTLTNDEYLAYKAIVSRVRKNKKSFYKELREVFKRILKEYR